ncbi:rod shape-determining protein MreD [Alteribacter lacisalsi]|uniref:Rod shape-determining protein MreD n=1 Tax=Alteribacter lacisalsi TaxID=2045244 RepID=A0A2W0HBE1_9BACI|nr:rod shape-determining protein MreD [Alteribacter lacisalsi]PYZ97340.1 rod shape-determining protein MreD [Alteribacter lacisalsi]
MLVRYSVFIVLFLLFILEGTIYQIFAPDLHGFNYTLVPRWVLGVIVFAGILQGRGIGLSYAIGFGIMYDIIYAPLLGVYSFGMALVVYLMSVPVPSVQKNMGMTILLALLAITGFEYFIYGIYSLMGLASMPHDQFFYYRLLPTFVFNGLLFIAAGYFIRKWLLLVNRRRDEII